MAMHGAQVLSNAELLGIIINNGSKEKSAVALAKDILSLSEDNLDELGKLTLKDLQKVKGIGEAKAIIITAALELGRRRSTAEALERTKINNGKDFAAYLQAQLKDYNHEVFAVLCLNNSMKIKGFKILSQGGITATVADIRLIVKYALEESATRVIVCHNHPSGNFNPSQADISLTHKIKNAMAVFDIVLVDHIIVSNEGYYSFANNNLLISA
jgi:DNA repair protein RadC